MSQGTRICYNDYVQYIAELVMASGQINLLTQWVRRLIKSYNSVSND